MVLVHMRNSFHLGSTLDSCWSVTGVHEQSEDTQKRFGFGVQTKKTHQLLMKSLKTL